MTVRLMPLRTTAQRHPHIEQVNYAMSEAVNTIRWVPAEANSRDSDGFSNTVPAVRIVEPRAMQQPQVEHYTFIRYAVAALLALVVIGSTLMTPFVRFAAWAGDAIHRRVS
jgi:hypothetical protein